MIDHPTRRNRGLGTRAQTAPLGVILILGIIIVGTLAILATGGSALTDAKRSSELDRAEQALAQFDAAATHVALGESAGQSVPLGPSGNGQYGIDADAGWIRVVHHDYVSGSNETVFNGSLGALEYRHGGATIAYQGGGVWRSDGHNGSTMIAPPEVHYRDATLVMPVVEVSGQGGATGDRRVLVTDDGQTRIVFPANATGNGPGPGTPYDATGEDYHNPIRGGSVTVTVQSEYYDAWGAFFRTRTEGSVTLDHAANRATVQLTAPQFIGAFRMPDEGNAIPIRGIKEGHQLERFEIDLAPDDSDSARFNNLQWSFYVKNGRQEFEIHLRLRNADNDPATPCKEQTISATVYYSDTNGNPYDGWYDPDAFRTTCMDRDNDGVNDEIRLAANLTGDATLTMQDLSSSDLLYANPGGATRSTSVTFDQHNASVDWEPTTFADGGDDTATMDELLNHYFALMGPNYDLVVDDKNSDTVSEEHSTGVLEYGARGRVTYMHITANGVRLDIA